MIKNYGFSFVLLACIAVSCNKKKHSVDVEATNTAVEQEKVDKFDSQFKEEVVDAVDIEKPVLVDKKAVEDSFKKQIEDIEAHSRENDLLNKKITPTAAKKEANNKEVAQSIKDETIEEKLKSTDLSHALFDQFLRKYVSPIGFVNYKEMKKNQGDLENYIKLLQNNPIETTWSKNKKLAYWINTYNAFTVKLILDHYPIKSITNIAGGKPWDKKWINLEGKTYSLNQIENDIIRPQFKEPRIHFAVNCAAKSCPKLGNFAYSEKNVNSKLALQTKAFITNSTENQISENHLKVSKIFDWYKEDFKELTTFIQEYTDKSISKSAKIEFNEYDWSINGN